MIKGQQVSYKTRAYLGINENQLGLTRLNAQGLRSESLRFVVRRFIVGGTPFQRPILLLRATTAETP